MGTRRCAANTKAGMQCKALTRHGEYCWIHLAQLRGVRIKSSTVPRAGKALFAARNHKKGDEVARYTGDTVLTGGDHGGSHYVLELSERISIDAARTDTAEGRMINDSRGSGKTNNVRFSCNQAAKTAILRATRNIKMGEELFVAYGRAFWPERGQDGTRAIAAESEKEAAGAASQLVAGGNGVSWRDPIVLEAVSLGVAAVTGTAQRSYARVAEGAR
jgi:hypothetical protein